MRKIPFGKPLISEQEIAAVVRTMKTDLLVHGPQAKEFESHFAAYTKIPYAVSASSCTAALHLSYFYLGIKPGDEVIVPAQTHVATAHAVELMGGTPVFLDAEKNTGNIDLSQLETKITARTKAISLVHYLGMPVQMSEVMRIAKKHDLFVVEDCALAIGTYFDGVHAGGFGDTGCFSFYPVKHLTTAEGGMLTTQNELIAKTIERQKAFGVDRTVSERKIPGVYDVTHLGFNYRMNEIEAAIGIEQLKKCDQFLHQRKLNYETLAKGLREIPELDLFQSSSGPYQSSYYCMAILLKKGFDSKRTQIINFLNTNGVGTSIYYPQAVPEFTYYKQKYGYQEGQFPIAHWISQSSISLPVGPHLDIEDMEYIVNKVKEAIQFVKSL